ncbi:MAG: ATP-dependent DNA helicase RecG [Pseudomonadota bacterium]
MRPAILNPLFAETRTLAGVGPRLAALIEKVAGPLVVDLVMTPPISVIDRSARPRLADAPLGALVTLDVTVDRHEPGPPRGRGRSKAPYRVIVSDETSFLTLAFFHAREDYLAKALPEGARRLISGRIEDYNGDRQMTHPDYIADPDKPEDMPLIEPVYPLTAGLTANVMRKAAANAVARAPALPEWQDPAWLDKQGWRSWNEAIKAVHAPESAAELSPAAVDRQRLAYDELLANQLALSLIRAARAKSGGRALKGDGVLKAKAKAALPYNLTVGQKKALTVIFDDMASTDRMVRLLQADVGAGKTIVAFFAMLNAVEAGAQAAIMAPTEILARQHLEGLAGLADAAGVTLEILTGRDKGREREAKLTGLEKGYIDILIGTHAIFQESVAFHDLGLVVIDEQHRFGVHQRMALAGKGAKPDLLVMTATPIPRTLALTAYGDMEVSAIREKPPGRKPVSTRTVPLERLDDVIAGVRRAAEKGEQAYWVCPLVEESDAMALTAAEARFRDLQAVFGARVGLVHGRMKGPEKDAVMSAFHEGALSVLIATTVIEVGVNAPNATIMVIEHAERFGLAQLHQLRGRVGRGEKPSACVLLYKGPLGETAKARLKMMRASDNGFEIAEEDLRLRGAGDFLGAAQSGFPQFRIADAAAHGDLLAAARDDAALIMERDAGLSGPRGEALRALLYLYRRDDAVKLLQAG